MDNNYIADRKRYLEQVRGAFANQQNTDKSQKGYRTEYTTMDGDTQQIGISAFVKLRVLLSIFLFAAFILCDRTENPLFSLSSKQWYAQIETNYDYTNLQKYVMMVTDFDKND